MAKQSITVELDDETIRYLAVLGKPIEVLAHLAHSAADGVRRPDRRHRDQTDESLRVERDKADAAVAKKREVVEGVADEVMRIARQRADQVVHAARDDVRSRARPAADGHGRQLRTRAHPGGRPPRGRAIQRGCGARARARGAEALPATTFVAEREATDTDLTGERAHVDTADGRPARSERADGQRDDSGARAGGGG